MLKRVHLYGEMAERFGPMFMLDVGSLKDVAQALGAQIKGFRQYITDNTFRVVAGKSLDDGIQLDKDQVSFNTGKRDIHIVPVVKGAKRAGIGKIIAGILIAIVAWWAAPALIPAGFMGAEGALTIAGINASTIAMFGVAMALSGASQLLTPKPKKQPNTSPERQPSFVFNGAVNTTEQGGCVPLIYGRTMVGSTVVSAGMTTDDITV
ncbi:tail assembly protein [Bosea caraganae]|uniref:Tail assembly protein n=1 Tax=Bosea caraganae TaxID=2763117 RepID=A0A370L9I1_9HYPH|nr:tail assembly protein [Bosea caraganae]RDJ21994.1 tail assembly protein [Bosea caraganae]RDJ27972.1 tail assembly protein [Bosea caraganae]